MANKHKILIVDDDLSVRESFALILEELYNIEILASGESAIDRVGKSPVDLVFLDVRMPGLDGIETLRQIKKLTPNTPVVMVTAAVDVDYSKEALRLGAANYLVKPFEVSDIIKITKEILKEN